VVPSGALVWSQLRRVVELGEASASGSPRRRDRKKRAPLPVIRRQCLHLLKQTWRSLGGR